MTEILMHIGNLDAATGALVASVGAYGAHVIFTCVMFFGETAIFISLLLSQQGVLDLRDVFIYATLGTLCADIFWFIVGRHFPRRYIPSLLRKMVVHPVNSFLTSVTKDRIFISILFLKFFIGARLAIIVYLGRQPMSFLRFFVYDIIGTIIYMVLLTAISLGFGHFIQNVAPSFHILTSIATAFLFVFFVSHVARSMYMKRPRKSD